MAGEIDFIKKLALDAGRIILEGYGKNLKIEVKKNAGWVTEIDKRSENFIVESILKEFPESTILSEECGEMRGSKKMKWIIDPLDGTSNYAHGFPWFCVSIGLEVEGKMKAGAIYQPFVNELYYAEKGKGAFLNDELIRVSDTSELSASLVATGFSYLKDEPLKREMKRFMQVQQVALGVRRAGSAALDLACVACGRFSGFWECGLNPWDVAAGFLLISEAGGKTTCYEGKPTSLYDSNFVVSNGLIHVELVNTIRV